MAAAAHQCDVEPPERCQALLAAGLPHVSRELSAGPGGGHGGALSLAAIIVVAPAFLLFPEGQIPSTRWRWVWRAYLIISFLFLAGQVIANFGLVGQRIQVDASGNVTTSPSGPLASP